MGALIGAGGGILASPMTVLVGGFLGALIWCEYSQYH